MTPPTDIRIQFTIGTSKLAPSPIIGEDLTASREHFERLTKANELAEQGRLYIHKAVAKEIRKDGSEAERIFQGEPFDTNESNGRREMFKLLEMVKTAAMERLYPREERMVAG